MVKHWRHCRQQENGHSPTIPMVTRVLPSKVGYRSTQWTMTVDGGCSWSTGLTAQMVTLETDFLEPKDKNEIRIGLL